MCGNCAGVIDSMESQENGQNGNGKGRGGKPGRSGPPGNKNRQTHGYYTLVATLNKGHLDKRTLLGRYQMEKEDELAKALGGDPSPQQSILITDTVKTMLYLGCLDTYLVSLKSAVRKGRVHPVLSERFRLAGHIRENLKTLGLERRVKVSSLAEVLAEDEPSHNGNGVTQP